VLPGSVGIMVILFHLPVKVRDASAGVRQIR